MKQLKRLIGIFLYVLFIGLTTGLGEYYGIHVRKTGSLSFNYYPGLIILTLYPIIIGVLLGLPNFITEFRKQGTWKCDWVKLIAAGIPTLYISLYPALVYTPTSRYLYLNIIQTVLASSKLIITLSGMAFGYLLLSIPYKDINNFGD